MDETTRQPSPAPAPARAWEVVREVWNLDGCLIDSTIQSAGLTEQEAAALAGDCNRLEEEAPTFGTEARVFYVVQVTA